LYILRVTRLPVFLTLASLVFAGGCAKYESKPLTSETVDHQLAVRDSDNISIEASRLKHPILKPLTIDLSRGISPDEAAVVAVVVNPSLRAARDQHSVAAAQLLQAGILPNPVLTAGLELPYDNEPGDRFGGYNIGPEWEVTSLITRDAKVRAAKDSADSIDLQIAWQEWQTAQAARTSAFDCIALIAQLASAEEADSRLSENLSVVQKAYDAHQKTLLDLSAAQTASQAAHQLLLSAQKDLRHQQLLLRRSIGFLPQDDLKLREDVQLPSQLNPPPLDQLLDGLEERRLDLLALKKGYESEDATLRAAILAQFPKISLGLNAAQDTSKVHSIGLGLTIDLPIFDRNQGTIAVEKATRQKLFDEYTARVFDARWENPTAIDDIHSINEQLAATEAGLPAMETLVETYRNALGQGNIDVLSYYSAQSDLAGKRADIIKLKQQLIENWIALEIASGRYLPRNPASPTTQESNR
jgi:outer membrane protein TolC